jgi:hypothetical protein
MSDREQFDTFSIAAPVPGRRTFGHFTDGGGGFDVDKLPEGVGWKTLHAPGRARPFVMAAVPAAKRDREGKLQTAGTTGFEGVSVVIGPWGQEPVEWATVQVSSKALHDGSNVLPMVGDLDLAYALDNIVAPTLHSLGYGGDVSDAVVARFDSVLDFSDVEQHGRYVAAFADNKPPIRGGRHVMHADQTLAMHFAGGMSRLYDKGQESKGHPEAVGRSRFEFERKRARLKRAGVDTVRDLALARLDREARTMFEDCGYDREVAPVADWVWKLMATVPVDDDGVPLKGFGTAMKRGALAHALLSRIGVDPQTHRNTLSRYNRLYEEAGVVPADVELFDPAPDAEVVYLDLHTQSERRKQGRRSA